MSVGSGPIIRTPAYRGLGMRLLTVVHGSIANEGNIEESVQVAICYS